MNTHLIAGVVIALCYFSMGLLMMSRANIPSRIYGYRTRFSKRNMDTWLEANHFAGRTIMIVGSILILLLLVFESLFPEPKGFYPAVFSVIVVGTALVFILTESHLRKIFFRDGKRKPYR